MGNVKRAMLMYTTRLRLVTADFDVGMGNITKMSPRHHVVRFSQSQHHIIDSANAPGAYDERVEHWLYVGGRAAADADSALSSRLMLQRLAQFCVTCIDFLSESH